MDKHGPERVEDEHEHPTFSPSLSTTGTVPAPLPHPTHTRTQRRRQEVAAGVDLFAAVPLSPFFVSFVRETGAEDLLNVLKQNLY